MNSVNTPDKHRSIFIAMLKGWMPVILWIVHTGLLQAQKKDTVAVLKTIQVSAIKKNNVYTSVAPLQLLNKETLQQLNTPSVGDAARYFSGVLVKDYGGIGGLKTISVRSLGASATGILYDGIPVSDLQTGQIDLSRFSTTFVQSLQLQQGGIQTSLMPARSYASAATLAIITNTCNSTAQKSDWQAGARAGSFNLWQPFAAILQPLKKNTVVSFNAEALYSKGNYPVNINNGNSSAAIKRSNADIKSLQVEAGILQQFADSSTVQVKTGIYASERGLPGAIVFFNNRSVQRLANTDIFTQARYNKKINKSAALLASAKYSRTFTKYTDPDFLNNQGGLNNRYTQQEWYGSIAGSTYLFKNLLLSAASDIAYNMLTANLAKFALPKRLSLWQHVSLQYIRSRWQLNASFLYTGIYDTTSTGIAAGNKNKLTPAIAFSFIPADESPFLLRFFYKAVFRMPTFNDLYYNFIGNTALRPEYSRQYNAGVTYTKKLPGHINRLSISADIYYNQVRDKIIAVPNQNLFVWTMLNLGKVSIKGVDINAETGGKFSSVAGWFARLAYTWQQATDISNSSSSSYKDRIPYTPDHSGSGIISFNYKRWDAGYSLLFSGNRYTLGENNPSNQLPGWLTQDIFISRLLPTHSCNIHIKAEFNNISNVRYDIVRYFPMPGRSWKISFLFNHL